MIVLPLSAVRGGDALGWAASIPDLRGYLLDVNARIAHTLADRAGRTSWILPSELARIAARNPGYAPDPYAADPSQFWPDRWRGDTKLLDPLAGDLRTMTSFVDARVALVPVELRFIPREDGHTAAAVSSGGPTATPPGEGRAVLRLALVDTRAMVVFWVGDLVGDPAPALTPAVAANLADRLAAVMSTQ